LRRTIAEGLGRVLHDDDLAQAIVETASSTSDERGSDHFRE
jgi:hypothetical protein